MPTLLIVIALGWIAILNGPGFAQEKMKAARFKDAKSCNEFAPAAKQALGKSVGVEQCYIVSEETVFNIKGQRLRRVEVRLTGAVEGWASDEGRKQFAKQIDVSHMLYLGETGDYVPNKRVNASMLRDKGLGGEHRMYEILGVSHFDAGQVDRADLVPQSLDLTGLYDSFIDRLDAWVEKGAAPTATKSDLAELGGGGVALPEVACPLGVYHVFPLGVNPGRRGGQETSLARFDGINQEPVDARGEFVDMNGNGVRDKRENVTQAWQRTGLLKKGEAFNRQVYVNCVKAAAGKLVKEGLLPQKVADDYAEQAAKTPLPDLRSN